MTGMAKWLSAVLMVVVLALAGCGTNGDDAVAVVNDEEIGRSEWQSRVDQLKSLYQMQGQEVNEELAAQIESQVIDELIDEAVLAQQAEEEGFAPAPEEVDAEYNQVTGQFQDEAELDEALSGAGLTRESLREAIAVQVAIQRYLQAKLAEAPVQVTDEEVQALYDEYAASGQEMPPLEEIRPMLVQQLEQERQGEVVRELVEDLRESSEITVLI